MRTYFLFLRWHFPVGMLSGSQFPVQSHLHSLPSADLLFARHHGVQPPPVCQYSFYTGATTLKAHPIRPKKLPVKNHRPDKIPLLRVFCISFLFTCTHFSIVMPESPSRKTFTLFVGFIRRSTRKYSWLFTSRISSMIILMLSICVSLSI